MHQGDCSLRALWQTLEQWVRGSLDQITLADLLRRETGINELVRSRLAQTVFAGEMPPLIALTPLTR